MDYREKQEPWNSNFDWFGHQNLKFQVSSVPLPTPCSALTSDLGPLISGLFARPLREPLRPHVLFVSLRVPRLPRFAHAKGLV